jgi:hypothetical protein
MNEEERKEEKKEERKKEEGKEEREEVDHEKGTGISNGYKKKNKNPLSDEGKQSREWPAEKYYRLPLDRGIYLQLNMKLCTTGV